MKNRVAIELTDKQIKDIMVLVEQLFTLLFDKLVSITPEERRQIPKMGDGSEPFVEKAVEYMKSGPEYAPPYVKAADMAIDLNAVKTLLPIYRRLRQLQQQLDDSIMLSGSEAYVAALAYYQSVKLAARMNIPGAKSISEDLSARFKMSRSNGSSEEDSTDI